MTTSNTTGPTGPTAAIARAAVLLEAVARDSEQAADFEVPLRCGQAANRLHAVLGYVPAQLPAIGDDATGIRTALDQAITLLSSLPQDELSDPLLDALLDARAAAAALPGAAVR